MMVLQNISCRVTRVPTKNFVPLLMIPASLNNTPPLGADGAKLNANVGAKIATKY